MAQGTGEGALSEWRHFWWLPMAGAVGYSTFALQTYIIGPFVIPLEQEFGWSRTEVMWGFTLSNLIGVFFNLAVGVLIDRIGTRVAGITGLFIKTGAIALLATATGTFLNWTLLWTLIAIGALLIQSTVWTKLVSARFDRARGLALALALSGSSLSAFIVPVLATKLIALYGWRAAFPGVAAIWLTVALPVVWFFYRDRGRERSRERAAAAGTVPAEPRDLPGLTLAEGMRSSVFWRLFFASMSYSIYAVAMAPNLVPLLVGKGQTAMAAAGIASLMGLIALGSRLSAGFLLDVLPSHVVGALIFLLPVAGCLILLIDQPSITMLILAVISIGMTVGAEFDVIVYLTSRHFGLKAFGALFGGMITAGAAGGAIGPVLAGWIHDNYGNYNPLLIFMVAIMLVSSLLVLSTGRPKRDWGVAH